MDKTDFHVVIVLTVILNVLPVIVESKTCWDNTWYNNSSPTNRSEYESVSQKVLGTICGGRSVIDAQCKDNRGEPFRVHKIDKFNKYEATCDVTNGLICNPFTNTTRPCPDFAIQYGCTCAVSTTGTPVLPASNTVSKGTRDPSVSGGNTVSTGTRDPSVSGGDNSRLQKGGCGNGATKEYICNLMLLLLCLMLTCI